MSSKKKNIKLKSSQTDRTKILIFFKRAPIKRCSRGLRMTKWVYLCARFNEQALSQTLKGLKIKKKTLKWR